MLGHMLESLYEIEYAEDGEKALDTIKSEKHRELDGVRLDLHMPVLDGFHVLEIMKEKKLLDIPVIIITAESTEENLQKTLPYCIRDFICKPFKPDAILKRLKTMYHLAW